MNPKVRISTLSACLFTVLIISGCGSKGNSPDRFDLAGIISYKGKPIPYGEVVFIPDTSKGNKGPATTLIIKEGQYQTLGKKGIIAGPHRVELTGYETLPTPGANPADSEIMGSPLFKKYKTEFNMPEESSSYDFEVPSSHK